MTFSLADKSRDEDCDGDVDVILDVDAVAAARAPPEVGRQPRVYKGERMVCDCGKELAKTNYSRHKRKACPNGDARP